MKKRKQEGKWRRIGYWGCCNFRLHYFITSSDEVALCWLSLLQVYIFLRNGRIIVPSTPICTKQVLVVKTTMAVSRQKDAFRPTWFWQWYKKVRNVKWYFICCFYLNVEVYTSCGQRRNFPVNEDSHYSRNKKVAIWDTTILLRRWKVRDQILVRRRTTWQVYPANIQPYQKNDRTALQKVACVSFLIIFHTPFALLQGVEVRTESLSRKKLTKKYGNMIIRNR